MRGYCFFFKRMEERWALLTDYLEATDLLLKRGDEKCGCDVNAVNRITGGHWSSSEKNRWRVQMSDELCCQYSARQVTDPPLKRMNEPGCFGKLCYQVNSKAGDWSSSEKNGWRVKMWMNPVNIILQGRDRSSGKNGVKSAHAGWTLRPLIFFRRMDEECRWGMNFGNSILRVADRCSSGRDGWIIRMRDELC